MPTEPQHAPLADAILAACQRIPPMWDLPNLVAVNPFLGWIDHPIADAIPAIEPGLGGRVLPSFAHFRERWQDGRLSADALSAAAERLGVAANELDALLHDTADDAAITQTVPKLQRFADRYDAQHRTTFAETVDRAVARWCAAFAAGDCEEADLFTHGVSMARTDRSLELAGLRGWQAWWRNVPTDVNAARDALAQHVDVPAALATDYCYRLIAPCYGWASYFRRFVWQESPPVAGLPGQLVLLLLWCDAFFAGQLDERRVGLSPVPIERPMLRLALQEAVEDDYAQDLLTTLRPPATPRTGQRPHSQPATRPDVQAVFCIDVRSEPLRRHLELLSSGIETRGFAGFFGVSLDWQADGAASARCPALLRPGIPAHAQSDAPPAPAAVTSAPAVFSYVELLGLTYGLRLFRDSLAPQTPRPDDGERRDGFTFDLPARADAAESILRNMSFGSSFARIVLLCGHASTSANNPHAAALQCGACGGHGGAINARVAAALLNDPLVRDALAARGRPIPTDTHFAPAVHDTTTDVIELLDLDRVPATHAPDVAALRSLLDRAGAAVRQERAPTLGLANLSAAKLDRALRRRAADYSEPRPEWGLARNAAFIAARRERTHRLNLQGRAFLHEYDARLDPDRRVLTLILCAPMVVASWINLQYFASTVDNDVFGSGNKAVHQRVGTIGVVLGNGGDLRTGLARQSVHDSDGRWFHDPLRLQVVIEAAPDDIDAVLAEQPGVRALIDHGWVRLFALSPTEPRTWRRTDGGWQSVTTMSDDQPVARPHA